MCRGKAVQCPPLRTQALESRLNAAGGEYLLQWGKLYVDHIQDRGVIRQKKYNKGPTFKVFESFLLQIEIRNNIPISGLNL